MRVATVATALFAAGAVAGPVVKRSYETVWTTVVVKVTVPPGYHIPAATPKPQPHYPAAPAPQEPEAVVKPEPKPEYHPPKPQPQPKPPVAQPQPQPQPQAPSGGNAPNDYAQEAVDLHNKYRAEHSAPPVVWDQELADVANRWVHDCPGIKARHHESYGHPYGQNMYGGGDNTCRSAIDAWYEEAPAYAPFYGRANPGGDFGKIGHYTQLVWKNTEKIGCATNKCPDFTYTICNYFPAGNFGGQYAENVSPN